MSKRRSWSFDTDSFDAWLTDNVARDNEIQLDLFRRLTNDVVANAGGEALEYLNMLGIGEDDFAEDGSVHVDKWYAACMANYLSGGPSDDHILLIRPALDDAGWSREDIDSLITGDKLARLARNSSSEAIVRAVAPYLDDRRYGGWLTDDRAHQLRDRLNADRRALELPSASVINRYPADLAAEPELLRLALKEAITVLESAIEHQRSIRILTRY